VVWAEATRRTLAAKYRQNSVEATLRGHYTKKQSPTMEPPLVSRTVPGRMLQFCQHRIRNVCPQGSQRRAGICPEDWSLLRSIGATVDESMVDVELTGDEQTTRGRLCLYWLDRENPPYAISTLVPVPPKTRQIGRDVTPSCSRTGPN
jgi:hypothetical protein